MVDATDLKSVDCKVVWVQVPLPPLKSKLKKQMRRSAPHLFLEFYILTYLAIAILKKLMAIAEGIGNK